MKNSDLISDKHFKPSKKSNKPKVNKPNKVKQAYSETVSTTQSILAGVEDLVKSFSLLVVVVYHAYDLWVRPVDQIEFTVRAVSTIVIGYIASKAVLGTFKKIGESK